MTEWRRLGEELAALTDTGISPADAKAKIVDYVSRARKGSLRFPELRWIVKPPATPITWITYPKLDFETSTIVAPVRVRAGRRGVIMTPVLVEVPAALEIRSKSPSEKPPIRAANTSTTKHVEAETACREWIKKIGDGNRQAKGVVRDQAQKMFSNLSKSAFDRAWAAAAPVAWREAGRIKPSNQIP